jgi:hypothetical protein
MGQRLNREHCSLRPVPGLQARNRTALPQISQREERGPGEDSQSNRLAVRVNEKAAPPTLQVKARLRKGDTSTVTVRVGRLKSNETRMRDGAGDTLRFRFNGFCRSLLASNRRTP